MNDLTDVWDISTHAEGCRGNDNTQRGVTNHWTGLLDWNTGLDYWTDIFLVLHILRLVFTHSEVGFIESC